MKGIVADIQRCSIHDGPGIRTTVFFKGCPLHCAWCHNPECISAKPQELFYAERCIGCGQCEKGCFSGARVVCGKEMTVEDILAVINEDKPYFGQKGGVTFSGGEPLLQAGFVGVLADACHGQGIHTAIETSLFLFDEPVLQKMDLIMADLKIWQEETHIRYTGVSAKEIKENLQRANELGIPMILRTPVIPEIDQGIPEIAAFAASLRHVRAYELLPYHPLGDTKRLALGLEAAAFTVPSPEKMKELKQYAFIR